MVMKKGLSEIIGFFILLIVLLVVLVPLALVFFSQPAVQAQQQQNAQSYKDLATQQFRDFEPIQLNAAGVSSAPVYFIYDSGSNAVYFVFLTSASPPVPLAIRYLMVFNGRNWVLVNVPANNKVISPANANAKYYGFPAIEIPLSVAPYNIQPSYVAAVTQYGNIIYASPPYVIPLPKAKGPAGIVTIDPDNFTVVQNPQFEFYPLPSTGSEPLMQFMRNLTSVSPPTLTFYGGYIGSSNTYPFTYDGSWFGPIEYQSSSNNLFSSTNPGYPWFNGTANGTFIYANLTLNGEFSGDIGHAQSHTISSAVILPKGDAQNIIFNDTAIVGQLSGTFDNVNITIPGELLNIHLTAQYNDLYVTISSEATGTYTYYLVNVSGTVTYTGQFVGTVNGKQESEGSSTISGMINDTINGVITSAKLYAGYTQGLFGYNYLNGYIAVVGQVPMTITFSGTQNFIGYYVAVPVINGEVLNPSFDDTQAYPAISTYSLVPFNITLNNFNGELTLINQYAQGVFKGNITFPQPNPLSLLPPDAGTFDGYLDGIFGGNYNYTIGQLGLLAGQPVILSVKSSNATIYPGYYIFGTGYVQVLTPLIVKVNLAIYNPTNNTLEIDKIQATMKVEGTFTIGGTPYSSTLFGSSEETLTNPIIVQPLSNYSTTLYLTIPVTNIFAPSVSTGKVSNLESFEAQYIELYANFIEPSGYSIPVTALIPPYTIPVYGSS